MSRPPQPPALSGLAQALARCCVPLLLLFGLLLPTPCQAAEPARETTIAIRRIQAGFLYNFIRFTSWPTNALFEDEPFVVGVLSDSQSFEIIRRELAAKASGKHPIVVRLVTPADPLENLHLLFVPKKAQADISDLVPRLASRPILTIGEAEDFLRQGGMIRLFIKDDTIHFTLNLRASREAGITLSSQLAAMADPDSP